MKEIVLPPAFTPISITNSPILIFPPGRIDDNDTDNEFITSVTTEEEESGPPADISNDAATTIEEAE